MRLRHYFAKDARQLRVGFKSGFTLVEALVSIGIGSVLLVVAMRFIYFATFGVSGITGQAVVNQRAGNAIEFIESRVRYSTSIAVDTNGNSLTLGFDDNYTNDSDGDKITYDDKDHYERFQFIGVNSTNTYLCLSNKLVYFTNITSSVSNVLISAGVRNLPGWNIFRMTNTIAVIRFGVVSSYDTNHCQAIDIQGTGVSLNRPFTNSVIAILPF
jgi:prepilin-type N-terminal cleavage/methylation domain-containing protein